MHQVNPGLLMSPRQSGQSETRQPGAEEATSLFAPRIHLVDPDPLTRALLVKYLRDKGFHVAAVTDMEATLPLADVLILALDSMQQHAGKPRWLAEKPAMPTIVLDRSQVFPGRAAALGYAPDARLSLPVPPRKLVATIRRVLSLARIESVDPCEAAVRIYRFSGWSLHCHGHQLESPDGESILLDKRDFEVLKALLMFPRQVLTRQHLIAMVWGADKEIDNRTLDRPVTHLRRHLGDDVRFPVLLKTVVGVGYRLDADVEKSF